MARQAIVHIGTQKTGSTSIQMYMSKQRAALLAQGAYYPASPGPHSHALLTAAAATSNSVHQMIGSDVWKGIDPATRIAQFHRDFAAEMKALPDNVDRVIFSDERLSLMLYSPKDIDKLASLLKPYFDSVMIVVYFRRQDHFLTSIYAEQIRTGQIREPDHKGSQGRHKRRYEFASLTDRWAGVFGEAAILPRIYENTPAAKFDSVRDFASVCRFEMPVEAKEPARSRPSMNLAGQLVLREIGALFQKELDAKQVTGQAWTSLTHAVTAALPGRGWRPTREEAASFVARFAEGNESIRRRWHKDRPSLFSTDFSEFPVEAETLSDAQKFEAACKVLFKAIADSAAQEERANRVNVANLLKIGNRDQARILLRRRLKYSGTDVATRLQLTRICIEDGNLAEARGVLDAALKLEPESKPALHLNKRLAAAEAEAGPAARPAGKGAPKSAMPKSAMQGGAPAKPSPMGLKTSPSAPGARVAAPAPGTKAAAPGPGAKIAPASLGAKVAPSGQAPRMAPAGQAARAVGPMGKPQGPGAKMPPAVARGVSPTVKSGGASARPQPQAARPMQRRGGGK